MLNDIDFFSCNTEQDATVLDAKALFSENVPYLLYATATSAYDKLVIFSDHFITTMRLVLSDQTGACIVQMSDREREVYYAFVDYQNDITITDTIMLAVVTKLDECIFNELTCKKETFINQAFNIEHTWDSCETELVDVTTVTLTAAEYAALPVKLPTITYVVIDSNSEPIAIYFNSATALWTKP